MAAIRAREDELVKATKEANGEPTSTLAALTQRITKRAKGRGR
jgi:hypothetical protein